MARRRASRGCGRASPPGFPSDARGLDAAAARRAKHQRAGQAPAGAVAQARGVIGQLVDGRMDEAGELDLGDRAEALRRQPDGDARDRRLGERRVVHPVGPKRRSRPSVARNTAPSAPTSSPMTMTAGSSCIARASARLTAWTRVISAIGSGLRPAAERCQALLDQVGRGHGVGEVEDAAGWLRRRREIGRGGLVDCRGNLGQQALLVLAGPAGLGRQEVAQRAIGSAGQCRLTSASSRLAAGIVGGGVVAEAIGHASISRAPPPARAAASPRSTASRTAITSLPSTCSPSMPAAIAFCRQRRGGGLGGPAAPRSPTGCC